MPIQTPVKKTLQADSKSLLLALNKELEQIEARIINNIQPSRYQAEVKAAADPLVAILKSLGFSVGKQKNLENSQHAALQQTRQLVNSALSRVQSLQLRAMGQAIGENLPGPGAQLELAMRVNDNIYPIFLYIQEKALREKKSEDEEKETGEKKRQLSKRWNVYLEFDLEDDGKLAAEVNVIDEKINTAFWADKNSTRDKLKSRIENLKEKMRANGLDVDDMHVLPGNPPARKVEVNQQLLDIQT